MRRLIVPAGIAICLWSLILFAPPVVADMETGFADVDSSNATAEPVTWLRLSGITRGCNPPINTQFCPNRAVTRGEMAAFLTRALELDQLPTTDPFVDDSGSIFEDDIGRLAAAGIARGCNPPENDLYCPDDVITRGQMAALLRRAFDLPMATEPAPFTDTGGSVFAADIDRLAAAGITLGCNPPGNDRYCPDDPVTRDQMATFIWRAFDRPTPAEPTRLVAAGDIARCEVDTDRQTAELVTDLFVDANGVVAALGDTVYSDGSPDQYRDCYEPTWGRHRFRTFPAVGNHEYRTTDASGYFDYFGSAAGDPASGWYSYTLGDWQILVLNSNCDEIGGCAAGDPQGQWLRDRLAGSDAECTLAYMHHPRFSSGTHGDDDELADMWAAFEDYGVEVVLAGHDHNYERFAPLTHTGNLATATGVQSFVVGTGGTWLRPADTPRLGSEVFIDDSHGVLLVDLAQTSYEWQFIDTTGSILDSGVRSCS